MAVNDGGSGGLVGSGDGRRCRSVRVFCEKCAIYIFFLGILGVLKEEDNELERMR